jgi:hypothetical protein
MSNRTNAKPFINTKMLDDNDHTWVDRIAVTSKTSGNRYIIARNVKTGLLGCSCPGYRFHRKCKHIAACAGK